MIEIKCDSPYCIEKFEPASGWRKIIAESTASEGYCEVKIEASRIEDIGDLLPINFAAKIACPKHWRQIANAEFYLFQPFAEPISEPPTVEAPSPVVDGHFEEVETEGPPF